MRTVRATVGRRRVRAFHLNDAKAPLVAPASIVTRRSAAADGGWPPFRLLLNDRRFVRVPKILETPKDPEPKADRDAFSPCCGDLAPAGARDAHPRAVVGDRTGRAARREGLAEVLAEGDQEIVAADPVPTWELGAQRQLGSSGVPRTNPSRFVIRCTWVSTQMPGA